jgi:two-component system, sensor histidine kinase PdtaS
MAGEVSAAESQVSPVVAGRFGLLPGAVATPLALVLTELLQNALQHGLVNGPGPAPAGSVLVTAARGPGQLNMSVEDNGAGLPEGFSLDVHASLGLQIVRTLVESELGGQLAIAPRPGGGTAVRVGLPVKAIVAATPGPQKPGGRDSGGSENGAAAGKAAAG